MANWLQECNLMGLSTSPPLLIPLQCDGALTTISWNANVPTGSSIVVQTRVSFDQGRHWGEWRACTSGGTIPDLDVTTKLDNIFVMYRILIKSPDYSIIPSFSSITFGFEPVIVIDNKGDIPLKPETWITKMGNGDIRIINLTQKQDEFLFTELIDQETVYINNETEDIETSLVVTYRYKNFNDNYLTLPIGLNVLRVKGTGKLQFRYEFKYL
ncbi:hypothetical protein ACFVSK_20975 [Cellulosimicrobium cellulans]|uniref:hypothetical protein n=1 Tax=Cellulosimicrobium cellulans TaxID=1710 RepID=UPI0036DFBA5C